MKIRQFFSLILTVAVGCHSPGSSTRPKELIAMDTNKPALPSETRPKSDTVMPLKTNLKGTTYAAGNFILFLRPDSKRYDSLAADEENGMGDVDSDFAVGITNTMDSVARNNRYKDIRVLISTQRYIVIKDCKNGPKLIDRDSIDYGVILSAPGKRICKLPLFPTHRGLEFSMFFSNQRETD